MTPAETILRTFVSEKGLRLSRSAEDRLKGSFVWIRASTLALTGDLLEQRVRREYDLVVEYLTEPLGSTHKEGFLVPLRGGAADPVNSPHYLDLLDLARRRESDPTNLDNPNTTRGRHLRRNALKATTARVRAVLAIVWRAAALERELWSPDGSTAVLNVRALDEVLSRRLRVVERMAHNVGSREEMLGLKEMDDIPRTAWGFGTEADRNWFDGLRVRLFEYPFTHPRAPIPPSDIGEGKSWLADTRLVNGVSTAWRLAYHIMKTTTRRFLDTTTEPFPAEVVWRFAAQDDFYWAVSPAGRYRIDLVPEQVLPPVLPKTAAEVIDAVFDYQSTLNGRPIRADFWGRAWMFCDHVCSALLIEALLFGRRRRKGLTDADDEFNALVARRPQVQVRRRSPPPPTGTVQTAFVALDAHLGVDVALNKQILMSSQASGGVTADPHFRNVRLVPDQLQVGDQVIIRNSVIMGYISSGGEWGLENAIVMDVDPSVDDRNNRAGIRVPALKLQGHGTISRPYDDYRQFMADIIKPNFDKLVRFIVEERLKDPSVNLLVIANDAFPAVVDPSQVRTVVQWSPYDDLNTIVLDQPIVLSDGSTITEIPSGPWWIILAFGSHFATPEEALQSIPKSIGRGVANAPGVNPMISTPRFTPPDNFWDHHVVFPLFEPVVLSKNADGLSRRQRFPWSSYFKRKAQNQPIQRQFLRTLPMDGSVIPGLFRRGQQDRISTIQVKIDLVT